MTAITSLATLKAAAATALVRSDFTDRIADSVPLAEAWLNRNLRLRMMETDAALVGVVSSATITLPTGFAEPLALVLNDTAQSCPIPMRPNGQGQLTASGRPSWYSVAGSTLTFDRPCNSAYSFTLRYLARFALASEGATNALLDSWPDLYLAALLVTVCATYLTDDPRLGVWKAGRDEVLAEVLRKEARSKAPTQLAADRMFTQPTRRINGYVYGAC